MTASICKTCGGLGGGDADPMAATSYVECPACPCNSCRYERDDYGEFTSQPSPESGTNPNPEAP